MSSIENVGRHVKSPRHVFSPRSEQVRISILVIARRLKQSTRRTSALVSQRIGLIERLPSASCCDSGCRRSRRLSRCMFRRGSRHGVGRRTIHRSPTMTPRPAPALARLGSAAACDSAAPIIPNPVTSPSRSAASLPAESSPETLRWWLLARWSLP